MEFDFSNRMGTMLPQYTKKIKSYVKLGSKNVGNISKKV